MHIRRNNFVQKSVTYCTKFICKCKFVQFKAICCTILGKVMGEMGLCSPCGLCIPFPLAAGALSKKLGMLTHPLFLYPVPPFASKLATAARIQKKRMICIIRFFERKTGFEPAALSLGS